MNTLEFLGFDLHFMENCNFHEPLSQDYSVGRVIEEHRERYVVCSDSAEFEAEITGKMRYASFERQDYPAVGDFVLMIEYAQQQAIIHKVLPRKSFLERKSASSPGDKQLIAANIDVAFIMQSADSNFNLNRLDRYISVAHSGNVIPSIILSKTDLVGSAELSGKISLIEKRHPGIAVFAISTYCHSGIPVFKAFLEARKTYCFLGSSGVGKTTLINALTNRHRLKTNEISKSTGKGKHTTSRRELIVLDNGPILIDTPGMRELGITESDVGIENTFRQLTRIAANCRFADCSHSGEPGCAVKQAIEAGQLDRGALENYNKLSREAWHLSSSIAEKRKKDKDLGKLYKSVAKNRKSTGL